MTPAELDRLVESIDLAGDPDVVKQQWNAFLNELLTGARLHAVAGPAPLGVALFTNPDGGPFLPVFTDADALRRAFPTSTATTSVGINDLVAAVRSVPELPGVHVNPTTRGLVVSRQVIEDMASYLERGHAQEAVGEDTEVLVGDPAVWPGALVADLAAEARRHPGIRRLWLRQLSMRGETSYLVLVDGGGAQRDTIFPALGRVVQMHGELTQPVDLKAYSAQFAGGARPFYERA